MVTEPPAGSATNERQLVVISTSNMTQVRALDIATSVNSDVRLAVASDDRLMVLVGTPGNVLIWTEAELTGAAAPSPRTPVTLMAGLQSLAIATNAQRTYTVGSTSNLNLIRVLNATGAGSADTDITILPASATPTSIAVVQSTSADLLAIADQTGKKLYLVGLNPPTLFPEVDLDHEPIGLAISPGGHWAYVLGQNAAVPELRFVQAVDLHRLSQNLSVVAGKPLKVGNASQQVVINAPGTLLYIPYLGAEDNIFDGGVAKVAIAHHDCDLWHLMEKCQACAEPNCVVLATIENYQVGDRIENPRVPPTLPADDMANHIARIDNRRGRRLLPSTQVLTEWIECLMEKAPGGTGPQGPQGPLRPVGPMGPQGPPRPGLETNLTQIEAISWDHNRGGNPFATIEPRPSPDDPSVDPRQGYVITFNGPVQVRPIDADHVFQILIREPRPNQPHLNCLCPVRGAVIPVEPAPPGSGFQWSRVTAPMAESVAFVFDRLHMGLIQEANELWVRLRGDFVLDAGGRAVDTEFVRAQLPTGDRPQGDPHGVQGGLFESSFWIRNPPEPTPGAAPVNINTAPRDMMIGVSGIGEDLADRIIEERANRPFTSLTNFRNRLRPSRRDFDLMRDAITVRPPEE